MRHNFAQNLTKYLWDVLAVCFIFWGIIALLTPFTPGSWLFFVGLLILFGRKRTEDAIVKVIGQRWFNKLRIKKILRKTSIKWITKHDAKT